MSADPVVEVVELDEPGRELALRDPGALSVRPEVTAADLVARLTVIREAMAQAMEKDVDYGVIPGTNKPALLKPGAEKLGALFQLDVQLENEKIWHDDGHLTVIARATVFHQPTGTRLGAGEGICTTREAKYAFRQGQWLCPDCGKPTVLKSKDADRDEFFCWAKKGGCGAKFTAGSPDYLTLAATDTTQTPNPNIADTYNTVDKMASKRARIDAVLAVTGASALFTQDVENGEASTGGDKPVETRTVPAPQPAPTPAGEQKKVTTRQLGKIAPLKRELEDAGAVSEAAYRKVLKDEYGVESATELTAAQASNLIERLEAKRERLRHPEPAQGQLA